MADLAHRTRAALSDRRIQVGAIATVAALAIAGLAVAGAEHVGRQDVGPELADHARLAVLVQTPRPAPIPQSVGRLATLDPTQADSARPSPEPVDPALRAVIEQERREQLTAVAEQRAFDARIRAEMNGSYRPDPTPTPVETPTRGEPSTAHWTSNSEDAAPTA